MTRVALIFEIPISIHFVSYIGLGKASVVLGAAISMFVL